MRLGKKKDENELTPQQELEQKVDAMMDPRREVIPVTKEDEQIDLPTEISLQQPDQQSDEKMPEIDVFDEVKTAPEVPGAKPIAVKTEEPVVETDDTSADKPTKIIVEDANNLPDPLNDPKTNKAVEEITRAESDKLLAVEDAKATKAAAPKKPKTLRQKIKKFFRNWWRNKIARRTTIAAIILLVVGFFVWPTTRYFVLNIAGVRSSASLKVVDQSTNMPLKNVSVSLGDTTVKTNGDGVAAFRHIKLGSQKLAVERVAFAPINKGVTIGWGSNPLPEAKLKAVGARYTFYLTDYLSAKPVTEVEVISGDASAFADQSGEAVLTLDNPETDTIEVSIKGKDYRVEKLSFAASTKTAFEVKMVPAQPVVYVSKQSGKYDVYKVDVDGKNKQLLLAGTGSERKELSLAVSPDGSQAALVSSRSNKRDTNRYLLDTLTLIDTKSGATKAIDDAQNIRLVDWVGNRLVYVATYAAPSAGYAQRQRLVTYNTEDSARNALVTSDNFNGIASVGGVLYYAIANSDPEQAPGLSKIRIDGSGKHRILDKQVWTVVRTSESMFALETPEGWYEYKAGDSTARKGNAPADAYASYQYYAAPGGSKHAWVDNRDGKGVLLVRDQRANDRTVHAASGLSAPIRWLNKNVITYRIQTADETADYVIHIDGGEPQKISDITAVTGLAINY